MNRQEIIAALDLELAQLEQVRDMLAGTPVAEAPKRRGRPAGSGKKAPGKTPASKGGMSAEARAKISAAQRARWAKTAR